MTEVGGHRHDEGGGASRSTDPALGSSSATDVSLREFVAAQIHALDRHMTAELAALRESTDAANRNSDKAISVAAHEAQERLAAHNGLIDQMQKQQATFATREAAATLEKHTHEKIDAVNEALDTRLNRTERFQATLTGAVIFAVFIGAASLLKALTG